MTSTVGTLSARLTSGEFLIPPIGIPFDELTPPDLLRLDAQAHGRSGLTPCQALFASLYHAHQDVGAIAYGQAVNTSGFSCAGLRLPASTIPESYLLIREPGFVSFREAFFDPERMATALSSDRPVALVQNAGALVLGTGILDAFDRLEVLEATAAALIESAALGEFAPMNDDRLDELRAEFIPEGGFQGGARR